MNFGVEHLYHDSDIPSNLAALDAKEKLRTRQRNARDEKQLKKLSSTLQRAHTVLVKRQEWEKNNIEQELHIIKLKTLSLNTGLKKEEEAENNHIQRLPQITTSSNSLVRSNVSDKSSVCSGASNRRSTSFRRHGKDTSPDLRYSAEVKKMTPVETCGPTNTVYMKKADIVTRNLHRLYKRKRERTFYIKQAVDIIRQNNQELLDEAKYYTRNKKLLKKHEANSQTKNTSEKDFLTDNDDEKEENYDNGRIENNIQSDINTKQEKIRTDNDKLDKNNNSVNSSILKPQISSRNSLFLEPISSVVVNPSESSGMFDDKHSKWMDIFRVPEMWKLFDSRKKVKHDVKPSPPAILTIRGKLRKTLLR